jgi:hypothetical protein
LSRRTPGRAKSLRPLHHPRRYRSDTTLAQVKGMGSAHRMLASTPASVLNQDYRDLASRLALQLPFLKISESMGNHDSKIVGASSVD